MTGELDELAFEAVKEGLGIVEADLEFVPHLVVEVFEELAPGGGHGLVDLEVELELERIEGGLDFLRPAAALIDGGDAFLEVHTGFDGTEHLVAGAEDAGEELEFLIEELENAEVRLILAVEEIDDHHIVLLAVAVAAADALLDALRIPRQVIVHD